MAKVYLFTIGLLVAMGLFTGCKTEKAAMRKVKVPTDFRLEIQHTPCRGMCPSYVITVDAEGNVAYEGRRAVDRMGKWSKKLSTDTLKQLIKAINDAKFNEFDELYGGGVVDLPSVITTVTQDGKTKKVEDIRNAPETLTALEQKLESLIGDSGYTEVK